MCLCSWDVPEVKFFYSFKNPFSCFQVVNIWLLNLWSSPVLSCLQAFEERRKELLKRIKFRRLCALGFRNVDSRVQNIPYYSSSPKLLKKEQIQILSLLWLRRIDRDFRWALSAHDSILVTEYKPKGLAWNMKTEYKQLTITQLCKVSQIVLFIIVLLQCYW